MERGQLRNVFPIKGQTVETKDEVVMVVWQYDYELVLEVKREYVSISYPDLDELLRILKANNMIAPSILEK